MYTFAKSILNNDFENKIKNEKNKVNEIKMKYSYKIRISILVIL